jgi:hypothetical protein
MSPTSTVVETCPVCRVEFTASPKRPGKHGTPTKTCPAGHATAVHKLRACRGAQPVIEDPVTQIQTVNIGREAILMLATLLDCYDRLLATLPRPCKAMAEGIFGGYIELARKMVR